MIVTVIDIKAIRLSTRQPQLQSFTELPNVLVKVVTINRSLVQSSSRCYNRLSSYVYNLSLLSHTLSAGQVKNNSKLVRSSFADHVHVTLNFSLELSSYQILTQNLLGAY